jgi:catechol 2,3-dioxygenase-like lactoylglutathione lyase family enzyme
VRLVVLVVGLGVAVAGMADDTYEGATFKRVTLVVADMERSLEIYRDILGFDLDGISESSEDSYSYPVFKVDPEASIRFATLSAGTQQVRTLALVEVTGMDLPEPSKPIMTASVIRVHDLDAVIDRLKGLELEVMEQETAEREGEFRFKEQAFIDFDGHLIVLYEIVELPGG